MSIEERIEAVLNRLRPVHVRALCDGTRFGRSHYGKGLNAIEAILNPDPARELLERAGDILDSLRYDSNLAEDIRRFLS